MPMPEPYIETCDDCEGWGVNCPLHDGPEWRPDCDCRQCRRFHNRDDTEEGTDV